MLAARLAGRDARYAGSVNATNLKVSGVNVFSAGDFLGAAGTELIVLSDPGLGTYKNWWSPADAWSAPCCTAIPPTGLWYLELIRTGAAIDSFREDLIFGRALVERRAA